ncbi:unnamed protein product, partial [Phaeothamnion confervicola]
YLDRSFKQDLLAFAPRIGPVVEELANAYLAQFEKAQATIATPSESWYTLPHMRRLYGFLSKPKGAKYTADLGYFRQIMIAAKTDVQTSGGTLRLVYIPDCPTTGYRREAWREPLLRMLEELKIPVIDTDPIIKAMQRKGVAPYFYCPASHFNAVGASAAAEAILRAMR